MAFTEKYPKTSGFKNFILKLLVKNTVVNEKPYSKNSHTTPEFIIVDEKVFLDEKAKLVNYIKKTQELGEKHFDQKESNSFGKLSSIEWNNMFYKHLNHHFTQFGV